MEENIRVVIRSRPLQPKEAQRGDVSCVTAGSSLREIQIHTGHQEAQAYACSRFFSDTTTQAEFFAESGIPGLLDSAIGGFHACSFAFGQTGAGKTYTCTGPSQSIRLHSDGDGVMGRSLQYLFNKLNSLGVGYKVKMACMEIYHENVYDLSLPEKSTTPLNVREHPEKGFFAEGCKHVQVSTVSEAVNVLDHAIKLRHTGSHEMNARSNRSHFMTEIFLELSGDSVDTANQSKGIGATNIFGDLKSKLEGDQDFDLLGKMTFIDLAGSERLKATKSTGQMQSDTGFINKSLYVLGKVIAGLVRGATESNIEVPFRESKLTKLLINSLGGKCRTLLISCISSASSSVQETLRTLKFSTSAAKIKNRPVRFLDPQEKLILDLRDEIKRLKEENKFLIVSLMANPQPVNGPKPSTGSASSLSAPPSEKYSQSEDISLVKAKRDHSIPNEGSKSGFGDAGNGLRHKQLKKSSGSKMQKKKSSPYVNGNSSEANELYTRLNGHVKAISNSKPVVRQLPQEQSNPLKDLRDKLAILKFELEEKRQFMEDNPGTVTDDHEKQLKDLKREVKEMHLELKAVSSLESLNSASAVELGFPASKKEIPIPKFDREKPVMPIYSPYDMNNKKVYDDNPVKKSSLAPLSLAPSTAKASGGLTEEELAYVHRKQHLDAYINGKKHLDSLPSAPKPTADASSKALKNETKRKKSLTPIEPKPVGKGFNSSQQRDLNYPGRKKTSDVPHEHVQKAPIPVIPKPISIPVTETHYEVQDVPFVHSKLKADIKPLLVRPTLIGKETDNSVFGINSSFDSRFENMLKNVASPVLDPYGINCLSPKLSAPTSPHVVVAIKENAYNAQSEYEQDNESDNLSNTKLHDISQSISCSRKQVAEETPEHDDNNDEEYADDGFEDAYEDDEFED